MLLSLVDKTMDQNPHSSLAKQEPAINDFLDRCCLRKFATLSGAHKFELGDGFASFRLPSYFAKQGINRVVIWPTAEGRFNVEFSRVSGRKQSHVAFQYAARPEELPSIVSSRTGLRSC